MRKGAGAGKGGSGGGAGAGKGGSGGGAGAKGARKKTPASFGLANIEIDGVEAAPVDFFVGNTNPDINEEKVKEILVKCGSLNVDGKPENYELKLDDIKVKCLNNIKDEPNPRTKCWRITVPHLWREVMKRDEFYPRGWSHRAFHHSRGGARGGEQSRRLQAEVVVAEQPAM